MGHKHIPAGGFGACFWNICFVLCVWPHLTQNSTVYQIGEEQGRQASHKMGTQGSRLLLHFNKPFHSAVNASRFYLQNWTKSENMQTRYLDTLHQFLEAEKHFFVCPEAGTPHIPGNPPHSWLVAATCPHSDNDGLTSSLRCIEAPNTPEQITKICCKKKKKTNTWRLCSL